MRCNYAVAAGQLESGADPRCQIHQFPADIIMESAADILKHLPADYHHVFDVVHFILCIQGDRADHGDRQDHTTE